jgi:hypothetical protein
MLRSFVMSDCHSPELDVVVESSRLEHLDLARCSGIRVVSVEAQPGASRSSLDLTDCTGLEALVLEGEGGGASVRVQELALEGCRAVTDIGVGRGWALSLKARRALDYHVLQCKPRLTFQASAKR